MRIVQGVGGSPWHGSRTEKIEDDGSRIKKNSFSRITEISK